MLHAVPGVHLLGLAPDWPIVLARCGSLALPTTSACPSRRSAIRAADSACMHQELSPSALRDVADSVSGSASCQHPRAVPTSVVALGVGISDAIAPNEIINRKSTGSASCQYPRAVPTGSPGRRSRWTFLEALRAGSARCGSGRGPPQTPETAPLRGSRITWGRRCGLCAMPVVPVLAGGTPRASLSFQSSGTRSHSRLLSTSSASSVQRDMQLLAVLLSWQVHRFQVEQSLWADLHCLHVILAEVIG